MVEFPASADTIKKHLERSGVAIQRQKFASQAKPELLAEMRAIAEREGRQLQVVLEEAMAEYIDRHQSGRPRGHVLEALAESIDEFDTLYARLAR